ncbi:uncharacterized protein LOC144318991 [Canis aureus]
MKGCLFMSLQLISWNLSTSELPPGNFTCSITDTLLLVMADKSQDVYETSRKLLSLLPVKLSDLHYYRKALLLLPPGPLPFVSPDIAKCPLRDHIPWMRTTSVRYR